MLFKGKPHGLNNYFKKKALKNKTDVNASPAYLKRGLIGQHSSFAAREAYKAARTNLLFTRVGDGCQKLAFTSTFASEGKTVNCCNLALTLAQNGQKVLIIDGDMRRPMVHNLFAIANQSGLSEFLAGLTIAADNGNCQAVPLVETEYPNLSVLPSGHVPPNPAELLASQRMKSLLEAMSLQFDYIFIDTPPISVVTDAAVLTQNIHGYLLVVRAGITPLEDLHSVVLKMEQLGANILGFILNDLDSKSGSYKYAGYRSYSKYGYQKSYGKYAYQQTSSYERSAESDPEGNSP